MSATVRVLKIIAWSVALGGVLGVALVIGMALSAPDLLASLLQ